MCILSEGDVGRGTLGIGYIGKEPARAPSEATCGCSAEGATAPPVHLCNTLPTCINPTMVDRWMICFACSSDSRLFSSAVRHQQPVRTRSSAPSYAPLPMVLAFLSILCAQLAAKSQQIVLRTSPK